MPRVPPGRARRRPTDGFRRVPGGRSWRMIDGSGCVANPSGSPRTRKILNEPPEWGRVVAVSARTPFARTRPAHSLNSEISAI
ncbi:hypothetical protein CBM2592_B180021 [Cupriavidus taiwanensis]|nr:hypothetical protein CBM2592_B180021 [Cupriavidus taiwanensis]SOY69787.1 hypothetical protein CBM2588_B200021 [Cupriavidus taiwanensis]SOY95265.1 hypothetical protein CBM2591_B170021 [Cupriavidus taiwanensis]SOZ71893.1 hypothetical protein CBM2617_B180230 [Cupriavidus taiwanensis]SOZ87195.1 hypothetical protein CBM2618_B200227 [Cupriavidus taiwanensis]